MEFIDKLNAQQQENALLIAREAKKMGINPRLAVALAFQESSLQADKVGKAGEVGIMQVLPDTGKMLGFPREKLDVPIENIRAGLTYLKMNLDRFGDPMLAVAGYNAGPDHPYFLDPSKKLPQSTLDHVKAVQKYGGFTQPEAEAEAEGEVAAGEVEVSPQDFMRHKGRIMTDVAGAGLGAATALGLDVGKKGVKFASNISDISQALADKARTGAVPGAPGALPSNLPPAQGPIQGPPAGGRMTQNWIRSQDAAGAYEDVAQRARSMGEAHQMKEAAIQAENKIRQIAPEMRQVPERGGLFLPGQTGAGPRGARTAPIPGAPTPGPLERVTSAAKTGAGALGSSPMLSGALGGLGFAEGAQEFQKRYQAGDIPGMMLSGMGMLGGLASVVPHPITRGVGTVVSGASPLTLYLLDKMRAAERQAPPDMIAP